MIGQVNLACTVHYARKEEYAIAGFKLLMTILSYLDDSVFCSKDHPNPHHPFKCIKDYIFYTTQLFSGMSECNLERWP